VRYVSDLPRRGVPARPPGEEVRARHPDADRQIAALDTRRVAVPDGDDMPNITPSSRGRLLLARWAAVVAGQPVAMVTGHAARPRPKTARRR